MAGVAENPAVQRGMRALEEYFPQVIDEAIAICEVPAPPFQEARRAEHVAKRLKEFGLGTPRMDAEGDVICEMPGQADRPPVMLMAHLDTVFGPEVSIKVRREGHVLHGPGIGDNSVAVASMLWLAHLLKDMPGRGPLVAVGNVGEEGLGNLRGAKAVWEQYGSRAGAWIILEGAMGGEGVNAGVASRRLKIAYRGPGGHSWRDFGRPSAIHALGSVIDQIARVQVPAKPKTTYNVGIVEGGRTVNTIAPDASMVLDMRSEDGASLADLERRIRGLIGAVADAHGVQTDIEVVGDRPGGRLPDDHWLMQLVDQAAAAIGEKVKWKSGSTDANVALSHSAPVACLGIARGDNLHAADEWLDVSMALKGLQQAYLVLAALLLGQRTLG